MRTTTESQLGKKPSLSKLQELIASSDNETKQKIQEVAQNAYQEIVKLEELAERHKHSNLYLEKTDAQKIKAIWVFSGPGTYLQASKNDRYEHLPWAQWMDKKRLNHAAHLQRKIAEVLSGKKIHGRADQISSLKTQARELIAGHAPIIIYNGRPDENQTVKEVIQNFDIIVPPEKVFVIDDGQIDKSVDQIMQFKLPDGLKLQQGDRIAIISHAPHLVRVMYMIEKFRDQMLIPPGVEFQLFPLPSPKEGKAQYRAMEIRGILYYALISNEAGTKPFPYLS